MNHQGTKGQRNGYLLAPVLLLALGAALRFWALDRNSLWTDEFFSLGDIGLLPQPGPGEVTPPLYFILLKQWAKLAGSRPGPLRLFSALWGVAGLLVTWLFTSRLIGRRAGLFALALTALSPWHLAYSQELRPYAMLFALSALSMWSLAEFRIADFGLRIARTETVRNPQPVPAKSGSVIRNLKSVWWIVYLISTVALLYTHYWGLFVWFAGALYALWIGKTASVRNPQSEIRNLKSAWPVGLAAAAFLPGLSGLMASAARYSRGPEFWAPPPGLSNLGHTLLAYTGTRFHVGGWLFDLGPLVLIAIALFAALWTTGLLRSDLGLETRDLGPLPARRLLVCYFGGLLLAFLVSLRLAQMFVPFRYTMAIFPAAVWLAARGWNLWPARARAVSAALLLALLGAGDFYYFTAYHKGNIKQAAELVAGMPVESTVLIVPAYLRAHWDYYYRGPLPIINEAGMDEMEPAFEKCQRAAFVTLDVPNVVKDAMDARYRRIAQRRYPADFHLGLVVVLYRLGLKPTGGAWKR